MTWGAAIFIVAGFLVLARLTGLLRCATGVVARSRQGAALVRDREMDEEDKERAVQALAKALFGSFFVITLLSVVALGVPLGIVWLVGLTGVLSFDAVMALLVSWQFLVVGTLLGFAGWWGMRRLRP